MRKIKADKLNILGRLREDVGLKREEVEAHIKKLEIPDLSCSTSYLCKLEKLGTDKKPSLELAIELCKMYKCRLEDIYPNLKDKLKGLKVC
ncbi:helix-turn-helix domain-containing protein [Ruminiclostridium hungatei]|uniref:helix-turn-helix domain-containing protein n=1 Tax=Ruminiclostridium hungatei TaxID=48256 RepID=UPI0009ABD856|nr:helix-turn-helix domain-containing protein [Ruminiclostridium hungatei]